VCLAYCAFIEHPNTTATIIVRCDCCSTVGSSALRRLCSERRAGPPIDAKHSESIRHSILATDSVVVSSAAAETMPPLRHSWHHLQPGALCQAALTTMAILSRRLCGPQYLFLHFTPAHTVPALYGPLASTNNTTTATSPHESQC
jgi:hypothetical protein